jgi:ammonium transporter, Amt family
VIGVSAGADVYAPTLGYLLAMVTAALVVYAGNWIETKARVDDVVGAVAVHGVAGFLGMLWVGIFAAGYPTGVNNVDSSIGGQLIGMATFLPLGFLTGWFASWVLRRMNLLRVPPEVEIAGLDTVEYVPDIYLPEVGRRPAQLVEPDGTPIEADPLIIQEALELTGGGGGRERLGS